MQLPPHTQEMVDGLMAEWEIDDRMDMLRCAQVNVEQLWKFAPTLSTNPIYAMTIVQLRSVIADLEAKGKTA